MLYLLWAETGPTYVVGGEGAPPRGLRLGVGEIK